MKLGDKEYAEYLVKVEAWMQTNDQLNKLKKQEVELRKDIGDFFFEGDQTEGTLHHELPAGYKLTRTNKWNRTVDPAAVSAVLEKLNPDQKKVIAFKPSLNTRLYKAMAMETKAIVDQALTTKPGLFALKLTPPAEDE